MKVGDLVRHEGSLGVVTHRFIPKHGWYNGVRAENYVYWFTEPLPYGRNFSKNWADYQLEFLSK